MSDYITEVTFALEQQIAYSGEWVVIASSSDEQEVCDEYDYLLNDPDPRKPLRVDCNDLRLVKITKEVQGHVTNSRSDSRESKPRRIN